MYQYLWSPEHAVGLLALYTKHLYSISFVSGFEKRAHFVQNAKI